MHSKHLVILSAVAVVLFVRPVLSQDEMRFEDYFEEGALRIDIVHSGTGTEDVISVRRVLKEPHWAGPRAVRMPRRDMGKYRLDVIDAESGAVVYRHGFSSLFGEWITTDEANHLRRAFEETLEMPYPRGPVNVSVHLRNKTGSMDEIFSMAIDPASHQIGTRPTSPDAVVIDLHISGPPAERVDVVVLGDGYDRDDMEKFRGDCRRFIENFFDVEPFKSRREKFNVRAVFFASNESGIDEPRKGIYRDTPFGMMFNMFDLPRYCMTEAVWAIHDVASLVPHDAILLMANSCRYGGGAIYNHYTVFVSDNEYDDYLTVHEFGHGFGGLGDEYYTSSVAYNEFYPKGVEPWEPNITALLDPSSLKWKALVETDTPLPTPDKEPAFANVIGAFEGAGYAAKGLYRPALDCKMFSKGNRAFCRVCEQSLIDTINHYVGKEGER